MVGAGPIGLFATISAVAQGAEVYVADVLDGRLEKAVKFGAKGTINSSKADIVGESMKITGGNGFDVCVEACGSSVTFLNCIDCAAFAANIILIGNGKKETTFLHSILLKKELNVFGSRNSLKKDFEEMAEAEYFESVVKFMPSSFNIVGLKAQDMLEADRRYTYITPKSFLELLKLFGSMYKQKVNVILDSKQKLESGLNKLKLASEAIAVLEKDLEVKSVEISKIKVEAEAKNQVAQQKAEVVGGESKIAQEEEKKVTEMKAKIEEESAKCQAELNKFKPIMDNCMTLAKSIKKEDLDKVRQIKPKPPDKIMNIIIAMRLMLAGQINDYIPIEVDNKALPKKNEKNDILALLLDTKKLIEGLQYFLEVIKQFKYNTKNFDNLVSRY